MYYGNTVWLYVYRQIFQEQEMIQHFFRSRSTISTNATKSAESNPSLSFKRFITSKIAEMRLGEYRTGRSPIFQTA